jgi:hypothetical protein
MQSFTLAPGGGVTLTFQWDQPFASAGGAGSANDLDIYIVNAAVGLANFLTLRYAFGAGRTTSDL